MLAGYREKNKEDIEWNWIPEEILYLNNDEFPQLYYPAPDTAPAENDDSRILLIGSHHSFVLFKNVDYINRSALVQVSIASPEKVDIDQMMDEALNFAFRTIQMNKVYGYICTSNIEEISILENKGFVFEAVIPNHVYWNGQLRDRAVLSLLHRDWKDGKANEDSEG
jgi:hypothetical protein